MEKKKRQQPMKEMLGLLAVALGWGALTLLVCYGLFLHLHVDYEDLMIWAPLSGVAIFTLALVRGALGPVPDQLKGLLFGPKGTS